MARFDIEYLMQRDVKYCAPEAREIFQDFLSIWVKNDAW